MTSTENLFATLAVTIIGSGLGTTIIGALFKQRFDSQLEIHKALLQRSGKIHERQVDALLPIYSKLDEALFYLQRAVSAGKFAGGAPDDVLLDRMTKSLAAASEAFSRNRLLISESLGQKLDEFFDKMFLGRMNMGLVLEPMVANRESRAKLWDAARQTAYKNLPFLLKAIRDEARSGNPTVFAASPPPRFRCERCAAAQQRQPRYDGCRSRIDSGDSEGTSNRERPDHHYARYGYAGSDWPIPETRATGHKDSHRPDWRDGASRL
jgi:hypothetical protein